MLSVGMDSNNLMLLLFLLLRCLTKRINVLDFLLKFESTNKENSLLIFRIRQFIAFSKVKGYIYIYIYIKKRNSPFLYSIGTNPI